MRNIYKLKTNLEANRSSLLNRVLEKKLEKFEEIYKKSEKRQEIRNSIKESKSALRENSVELKNLSTGLHGQITRSKDLNRWSQEVVKGANHFQSKKVVEKDLKIKSFNRLVILTEAVKKTMENDKLDMVTKIQAYKVLMSNIDDCMNPAMVKKEKKIEMVRENIKKIGDRAEVDDNCQTIKKDGASHPHMKILATRDVAVDRIRKNQGLVEKIVGCYQFTKSWFCGVKSKGMILNKMA